MPILESGVADIELIPGIVAAAWARDARVRGKAWQNAGKTVAAVADEDPVRVLSDPFGLGLADLTAVDDNHRPKLNSEGGGLWSWHGSTTDDRHFRMGTNYVPSGPCSFFAATYYLNAADFTMFCGGYDIATWVGIYSDGSYIVTDNSGSSIAFGGAAPATGPHVFEINWDGAAFYSRVDGGAPTVITAGAGSFGSFTINAILAGFNGEAGTLLNRHAAVVIVDGAMTAADRTRLTNLLKKLVGI